MKSKLYKCEIPGCSREVSIRSSIKTEGEFYGLKCCSSCKAKIDRKVKVYKPINKFNESTLLKRKLERKDLPSFFEKAIRELKLKPICQNCGERINANFLPVNNVAHLLKKSFYKSVMSEDLNRVFLCSAKDFKNNCHEKFDGVLSDRLTMPVFPLAVEKYNQFKHKVTEIGNELLIYEQN